MRAALIHPRIRTNMTKVRAVATTRTLLKRNKGKKEIIHVQFGALTALTMAMMSTTF